MNMRRSLVAVISISLAGTLHAQSLADVAKKTEQERAKSKQDAAKADEATNGSAPRVYTNKDLTSSNAKGPEHNVGLDVEQAQRSAPPAIVSG